MLLSPELRGKWYLLVEYDLAHHGATRRECRRQSAFDWSCAQPEKMLEPERHLATLPKSGKVTLLFARRQPRRVEKIAVRLKIET